MGGARVIHLVSLYPNGAMRGKGRQTAAVMTAKRRVRALHGIGRGGESAVAE